MARNIFELFGTITVNGLDGVKTKLSKLDDQFKQTDAALGKLGRQSVALGTAITKNVTLPLVALGAGLGVAISKTVEYADSFIKLNAVTGLSTGLLQEFSHVANIKNIDFSGLAAGMNKFIMQLPKIAKEGGPAYDTIKALGVNIFDAIGHVKKGDVIWNDLITKLQGITNQEERSAFAGQIFGKSFKELAPILAMSSTELAAMRKEAHDLGLVISEEGLKSTNAFGDEVTKLKEQFGALGMRLASSFIPVLRDDLFPIIQKIIGAVSGAVDWFKNLEDSTKRNILVFAGLIATIGPAILIAGKMVFVVKSLVTAFALAKAAAAGFSLAMSVNPFGIAAIGAAAFLGLLIAIAGEEKKRKGNEAKTAANEEINKQIQEFNELAKIQQDIIQTGEASKFKLYSKESVDDAKANLKSIMDAKKTFLRDAGFGNQTDAAGAPTQPKLPGGDSKDKEKDKELDRFKELAKGYTDAAEKEKKADDDFAAAHLQNSEDIAQATEDRTAAEEEGAKQKDETTKQYFMRLISQNKNETQLLNAQRADELSKVVGNKKAELYINEYYDKLIVEKKKSLMVQGLQFVGDAVNKLGQLLSMNSQNHIQQVENEQTAQEEAINRSTLSEAQKKVKIDALHADTAKKEKKLRHDSAVQQKAVSLVGAIINTALAVVGALAAMPGIPGIIMAAIVGALGAIEIGIIAAQPIPAAKGAYVPKRAGGVAMQVGEGNDDEIVMPVKTGIRSIVDGILQGIRGSGMPQGGFAFAGAGGGSMRSGDTYNFNVGNFIGDDHGVKEFERRLSQFRISDAQRKGEIN